MVRLQVATPATRRPRTKGRAMNSYAPPGILHDARQGGRVGIFAPKRVELSVAFKAIADQCHDAERINRANGRERIEFPNGGRITFHCTSAGSGRGVDVDVAYVDGWNELSEATRADSAPASMFGELIRA